MLQACYKSVTELLIEDDDYQNLLLLLLCSSKNIKGVLQEY